MPAAEASFAIRSMTGFGVGRAELGDGHVVAEVRSVNGRFRDVRARVSRDLGELTMFTEQIIRQHPGRGRVEVSVRSEGPLPTPVELDVARARAVFRAFEQLRDELAPSSAVPLELLTAVPDLFAPPATEVLERTREAVREAIERALEAKDAMCSEEGEALARDLLARVHIVRGRAEEAARRAAELPDLLRARLRERLARLELDPASGLGAVAPDRLEAEIVMHADRCDVAEELTRLQLHLDHFEGVLRERRSAPAEPVGRKLDFLLQEMMREANTLGAKAQDATLSHEVVTMKVEIERMREQVQNVE